MQTHPTVKVINVKRPKHVSNPFYQKKEAASSIVRVTRIKSRSRKSLIEEQTNASVVNLNLSSIKKNDDKMKFAPVADAQSTLGQSRSLYSASGKHEVKSINQDATSSITLMNEKEPERRTNSINKVNSASSKVAPFHNSTSLQSAFGVNSKSFLTNKQIQDSSNLFRLNISDRRQLYTIGKKTTNEKRRLKQYFSCTPLRLFLLILLIVLILLAATVIPSTILALKTTPTITSIFFSVPTTITPLNNSTSTTVTTSTTSTTTTDTTTTVSTTSTASTVTITSNICTASITGIEMITRCGSCAAFPVYVQFIYNYTAIANRTRIAFAFRRETRHFALDDISIQDYTVLGTEILVNGDFETGSLSPWLYCNQFNASSTGGVKPTFIDTGFIYFPKSGTYYYVGGSTTATDYIIQTFPTQIGHLYKVSMWGMYPGTGNLTSADFFLGV